MRKRKAFLTFMAAAGFGVMTISVPLMMAAGPQENSPAAQEANAQPLTLPAGFVAKDIDATSGVKSGLVKLTDRALTKGDFNSFLAELSSQDKERAREFKGVDQSKLDSVISQIQEQWKAKYGQDFKISDKNLVFNDQFQIAQGQVSEPTVAVNNWPVAARSDEAVTAANKSDAGTAAGDAQKEADAAKLTRGTDVAIVRFPADGHLAPIDVSMIHQALFWRVDIPNDRTGEQIYNDLLAHLNHIQSNEDRWPADENDGYRMVARNVVEAVYGIPVPGVKG